MSRFIQGEDRSTRCVGHSEGNLADDKVERLSERISFMWEKVAELKALRDDLIIHSFKDQKHDVPANPKPFSHSHGINYACQRTYTKVCRANNTRPTAEAKHSPVENKIQNDIQKVAIYQMIC